MSDREAKTGKKRRGRPPGPSGSVRPHRVVTFVTTSEFERLSEIADVSGKSLSVIVHDLVALGLGRGEQVPSDGGEGHEGSRNQRM